MLWVLVTLLVVTILSKNNLEYAVILTANIANHLINIMESKLDRLVSEWIKKHPKATLEEAFKDGYLRHVDAWINREA